MNIALSKHFVTFVSPGTFFPETDEREIDSWDTEKAMKMARKIKQRYNATPYCFYFVTYGRDDKELDSKEIKRSNYYYLGGKIETLDEIERRRDPKDEILLSNMRSNDYKKVIVNSNSFKAVLPFQEGDVVLDYKP